MHGGVVKHATAIGARPSFLEASIPRQQLLSMFLARLKPLGSRPPPVLGVVGTTTFLAPRLMTGTEAVKVLTRLDHPALPTSLHSLSE
jgi:hypothetical protein